MIIDFHTHTFPARIAPATLAKLSAASHSPAFTDGTNEDLVKTMTGAGVDLSVVLPVATNPGQVVKVNDAAAAANEQWAGQGIHSFGCIHPDHPHCREELARVAALGLKGIKIHPVYQEADMDDIRYLRILERAGELGLIVVAHSGQDIGFPGVVRCAPAQTRRALEQVGPVTMVLAHMGGWRDWHEVYEQLGDTSVYLDTSFSLGEIPVLNDGYYTPESRRLLSPEDFVALVRRFGAERVVFGTDSPWNDLSACLRQLRALSLTEEERNAILGGNGRKLLNV